MNGTPTYQTDVDVLKALVTLANQNIDDVGELSDRLSALVADDSAAKSYLAAIIGIKYDDKMFDYLGMSPQELIASTTKQAAENVTTLASELHQVSLPHQQDYDLEQSEGVFVVGNSLISCTPQADDNGYLWSKWDLNDNLDPIPSDTGLFVETSTARECIKKILDKPVVPNIVQLYDASLDYDGDINALLDDHNLSVADLKTAIATTVHETHSQDVR